MDITCANCQNRFKIADDKIPPGRSAAFSCPICRACITASADEGAPNGTVALNEIDTNAYNPADRPFDFIEEEGKTALVCEHRPQLRQVVIECLKEMEYQITLAESARDALKRMRYHVYDLMVLDEDFDTDNPEANAILIYLERLAMAVRRQTFVTMISSRFRTMDNMTAFLKSVNLIINTKNIADMGKILSRGITEHLSFYRIFREKLKEVGRA